MISVLFDSNIFNKLDQDISTQEQIRKLTSSLQLEVIANRTLREENKHTKYYPLLLSLVTKHIGNTLGQAGMRVGDTVGSGNVFRKHLFISKKNIGDAFIADAAASHANWLVSEEKRMRNRLNDLNTRCEAITYSEFVSRLNTQFNL